MHYIAELANFWEVETHTDSFSVFGKHYDKH